MKIKYTAILITVIYLSLIHFLSADEHTSLLEPPVVTQESAGVVYVIPIEGMIEEALLYVIRRGAAEAADAGASAVIFTLETPGGTVAAAEKIVNLILSIETPTYALVDKNAISAGAIIALATDHIYMTPGSKIGDAMPIMVSPVGGPQETSEGLEEKQVSYVSGLIRATAQNNGHDAQLAEAMVRREMEYSIDGQVICPEGQLLTLTNLEAEQRVGSEQRPLLSQGTVENLDGLLAELGLGQAEIKRLEITAAERLARLIKALGPLLLIAGLLGVYIEVKSPGFGIPGLLGGLALLIFFMGHHIAGLSGSEDVALFMLGVLLLLVELLLLPGFGIAGLLGVLFMFLALLNAMVENAPSGPWYPTSWPQVQVPIIKLFISMAGTVVGAWLLGRWLPKSAVFSGLILNASTSRDAGYTSAADHNEWIGLQGQALSDLRPSGIGRFNRRKLDIITDGDFIDAGSNVEIVDVHGSRIVVRKVTDKA